ncbi:peptidoglycan-binding protein [Nakamurella sp.]|uniref:peptidoglycan-binding protein n=1 Tax=Nakamurella sp. TaxID=1869182 RepID=UPI003784F310
MGAERRIPPRLRRPPPADPVVFDEVGPGVKRHGLLALQSTAGNRAVTLSLRTGGLQRLVADPLTAPGSAPRLLRQGSHGEDVRHVQDRLNAHGATPPLVTDAIFGPLTHKATVAYQRTHALTADAVIGPRTSASLNGPIDVGGSSGQGRTPPSGAPPASVLRYDTASYRINPPTKATTLATLNAEVKTKQTATPPDLGPTVTVIGVTAGSQAELFVWNTLVQLGTRARWGTEVDLVTAIGPAPVKPPGPAPVGRVTIRIDAQGNAAATLVAAGPPAAVAVFPDLKAAIAAIQALGFASVKDGSGTWTVAELSKVHAALSRLPATDRAAFGGVELIRESTLTDDKGQPLAGQFSHRATLATGATTATRSQALKIADLAFAADGVSFIGDGTTGGPASFHTIVHEAGHAVETKALRDAQFATLQAQGVLNGKITAMNAAITKFNTESRTAFGTVQKYSKANLASSASLRRTVNGVTTRLQAMSSNDTPAQNSALEAAATKAIAARDKARADLAKANAGHPALTDFASTITAQGDWFTTSKDRAAANTTVHDRRTDEAAVTGSAGRSKRLTAFVAVVTKNKIPPLTEYARTNWPDHPEEFFAEAYSFWQNDRQYLGTNAPALVTWFDAGEHLK